MNRSKVILLSILVVFSLFSASLGAQDFVLKLAHLNAQQPFEIPSAAIAAVFKSSVEANSNGRIEVQIFDSGVLGKERETMIQVQNNIVQSYIASTGGMSTFYPLIDVTNLPFAFSSYSIGYKVYDGDFGREMAEDIRRKTRFKVLGFGESGGFFAFTNSRRPVRTPADMRGLKIRTMTVPLHQDIVRSLGGTPTAIAWAEVYTSLQTGVVDGQMNPISIINMAKFYEVQKYITLTNHLYAPYVWVMSDTFYQRLPEDLKSVIDNAAQEALLAGRGLSRLIDSTEKGLPVLQQRMEVYTPTAAQMREFRNLTIPSAKAFIEKQLGREGAMWVDKFLKAIEEAERD
jgi:tripartite ATP-independent transporter DctP family solute receptor